MKATNTILTLLALVGGVSSCTQTKEQKIEKFKKELSELKGKIAALKEEMSPIEDSLKALEQKSTEELALINTVVLKKSLFVHYLEVQARIESDNNLIASAQMPGKVVKVYVKEGDRVGKGQTIAMIDAETIQKGIEEVKNQYELAKTVYEKQKGLWEQKIGTEIQYLQAKNNKESLEKRMESLNAQLDLARIKAPIAGVVDELMVKEGENAMGPVARIVNSSDYKVSADVAETYVSKINIGDALDVEITDLGKTLKQRVTKIGEIINPMSRTFSVESKIGSIPGLKPNMIAKVKLQDYKNNSAISVPVNVLQNDKSGMFVFIAKEGKAVKRPITTGYSYGSQIEVLEGLNEGDQLITVGFQDLVANQKVSVK